MSPSWLVLSLALLLVAEYATGNLIRGKSHASVFSSKDVPVPRDNIEGNDLSIPAEPLADPQESTTKKCVNIGDFCVNHSDCCSFACLGYMKRCVSGSG